MVLYRDAGCEVPISSYFLRAFLFSPIFPKNSNFFPIFGGLYKVVMFIFFTKQNCVLFRYVYFSDIHFSDFFKCGNTCAD